MIRLIEETRPESKSRWFQCNVEAENLTGGEWKSIVEEIANRVGVSSDQFNVRLGSGFFKPGMHEIFYVEMK